MSRLSLGIFAASKSGGGSFESIATLNGTGSTGSLTFSSIPSTYKHLQLRAISRNTAGQNGIDYMQIRFNSDTATNYSYHSLVGNGAGVTAIGAGPDNAVLLRSSSGGSGLTADVYGVAIIDILDYANTSKYKTVRAFSGGDNNSINGSLALNSGSWRNTNAINSILIEPFGGGFTTPSVFALYGIKG